MKSLSVHVRSYEKHEDEWRRVRYVEMIKDYGQKNDQTGDKAKDQLQIHSIRTVAIANRNSSKT